MNAKRFRLITFDLDDTLWDVRPVLVRAEERVDDWMTRHCPDLGARFDRLGLMNLRAALLRERPELRNSVSALRREAVRLALLDCGYEPSRAAELSEAAFAVFLEARHDIEPFPEVEQCLETLARNHMLGVLTNGNADIFRLRIGRFFRFAFTAEGLASSKPDPAHFDAALAEAGCRAEQCIHVGDHHEHDMLGAQRLGFTTVWFNPQRRAWPGGEPPSAQFTRFGELPALIEMLENFREPVGSGDSP